MGLGVMSVGIKIKSKYDLDWNGTKWIKHKPGFIASIFKGQKFIITHTDITHQNYWQWAMIDIKSDDCELGMGIEMWESGDPYPTKTWVSCTDLKLFFKIG
jgi:hypothetical protein